MKRTLSPRVRPDAQHNIDYQTLRRRWNSCPTSPRMAGMNAAQDAAGARPARRPGLGSNGRRRGMGSRRLRARLGGSCLGFLEPYASAAASLDPPRRSRGLRTAVHSPGAPAVRDGLPARAAGRVGPRPGACTLVARSGTSRRAGVVLVDRMLGAVPDLDRSRRRPRSSSVDPCVCS